MTLNNGKVINEYRINNGATDLVEADGIPMTHAEWVEYRAWLWSLTVEENRKRMAERLYPSPRETR